MKKFGIGIILGTFMLTACSNSSVDVQNAEQDEDNGETIQPLPKQEMKEGATDATSQDFYRSVIPYKLSPARGLTSSNMVSVYNMETFEKGLFEISKEVYPTDEFMFQEGQIMSEEMTREYLKRQYTEEEIDNMDEEEMKEKNAFSNLGLNPSTKGIDDPEQIAKEAPLYLSHILEQDYLKVDDDGNQSFDGITFGLAMNSEYTYQKEEYGNTYEESLDEDTVKKEGEEMAKEILDRLRANSDYVDKEVTFAIFIQSKETDIIPGDFVSYAVVDPGDDEIDAFEDIDEKHVLFPSNDTTVPEDLNNEYNDFNRELASYFDSFTTSVGRGILRDGKLDELTIEIPLEYESRGEMVGLSQYVRELTEKYFEHTQVEVTIKDKSKVYSTITSDKEGEASLYIME